MPHHVGTTQMVRRLSEGRSVPGPTLARVGLEFRRLASCSLILAGLVGTPASASADDWIEVTSPHFRVLSSQGTRTARRTALELERIRELMRAALPGVVTDPLRPVVVFAVKGADELTDLLPVFKDGQTPAGVFRSGQFTHHIVIRVEAGHEAVYHEYFHLLTRLSARHLPLWLVEGLAEFHSHVDFSGRTVKVGQPDTDALAYLRRRSLVPLREFLAQAENPHFGDPNDLRVFYAQAWALTHLLIIGHEDPTIGQQALTRYIGLSEEGADSVEAFEQAVGNIDEFDRHLREYIRQITFRQFLVEPTTDIDDQRFDIRELSSAEALVARATVLIWGVDPDVAGPLLEEAEALEGSSAALAEAQGLLSFRQGNRDEADQWFAEAVRLDSSSYVPHFLHAWSTDDPETRMGRLRQATARNPFYAPAYAELARLHANASSRDQALAMARRAIELDTGEGSYWILMGRILLTMDQPKAARIAAQRGQTSAPGPEAQEQLAAFIAEIDDYVGAQAEQERRAPRRADPLPRATRRSETRPTASATAAVPESAPRETPGGSARVSSDIEAERVVGTWTRLDCQATALSLVIEAEGIRYDLRTIAPEPIQVLDPNGNVQEQFFCGPQDRAVSVEFMRLPQPDGSDGVLGLLTMLQVY